MAIDYRKLLMKYIKHIIDKEGVSFIGCCTQGDGDEEKDVRTGAIDWHRPLFTLEEIDELQRLAEESIK